jgi:4-hydroxy-tetrahydrodipicolinate synthase
MTGDTHFVQTPMNHPLSGIYAAVITPLYPNYAVDESALPYLLDFLARRGCHGALLFGTTGEGPSFGNAERVEACRVALQIRQAHPDFKLLLGTGTPSLDETIALTRAAFDLGFDGAVVLPPYYFRKASDDGLYTWFAEVIRRAVPSGGAFFGYHIPPVSGVALSFELLARLKDSFPDQFTGLKDSSADREHGRALGERFGGDLLIFCGTDPLLGGALQAGAGGCITAPANLFSPELRRLWDVHFAGGDTAAVQARIESYRAILDRYPPAPALLKALIARLHDMPRFPVRPPLMPVSREVEEKAYAELQASGLT